MRVALLAICVSSVVAACTGEVFITGDQDAGGPSPDGATADAAIRRDAGPGIDGGQVGTDAGPGLDAGPGVDAGPGIDAGPRPDAGHSTAPDPDLLVAFIGDTGNGGNFRDVLALIVAEGADMVLHQGDFDYDHDPAAFFDTVDSTLGGDYPYFGSVGNHDEGEWAGSGGYAEHFLAHMDAAGVTPDDRDLDDQMYSATYRGLRMVFVGADGHNAEFASFVDAELAGDAHIWRICGWHKNQEAMQIGGKGNEMGWDVYENCRQQGAIIATGHEHSYERTRTLIDMTAQVTDTTCGTADSLCVGPGRTFAFVSGLGGASIRDQQRCLPATFPYGCRQEWAFIYTSNQGADYGALFIRFNVGGDTHSAQGYFKNVAGDVVDTFDIHAD